MSDVATERGMDGYGRPPEPWERRNPSSWDREPFQRDWYDRERGIQPNEWEEHAGAPIETWDKRGAPRDVGLPPAVGQQWERGRLIEYDQGDEQWEMEDRLPGREMLRRDERFGAERERQGGRDPYYDRERGSERERTREAEFGRSRRSHSSERSRSRNRDYEGRREYRRRSRSRSRSRSRERRRERDDERRRRVSCSQVSCARHPLDIWEAVVLNGVMWYVFLCCSIVEHG